MSVILTLATEGYREFGVSPVGVSFSPAQATRVAKLDDHYHSIGKWVRRKGRKKGQPLPEALQLLRVVDHESFSPDEPLAFIDEYNNSEFTAFNTQSLVAAPETLSACLESAESETDRWRGMYRLTQAIGFAEPQRLKGVLREAFQLFFRLYPYGRIAIVRNTMAYDEMTAIMRVMYTASQIPVTAANRDEVVGIRTMQEWHQGSILQMGPLLIESFLQLFYPYVLGFRAGPPGLDIVFLFDPPEEYTPAVFPRNWLAWGASAASFGRESHDHIDAVTNFRGPTWQAMAHQRHRHTTVGTIEERVNLFRWYLARANRLLYELTDVANFTHNWNPDQPINPVATFEHLLTVDRLIRKTVLASTLEDTGTARSVVWEVAEVFDALSEFLGNHHSGTEFFKRLFHPTEAPNMLVNRLSTLPAPYGAHLSALTSDLYQEIETKVIDSVWLRPKVTPTGVLVRDKALAVESEVPRAEFVAEVIRCYRNAHHGYFTSSKNQSRPSRFLFLVDGNLPSELTALPALWWLSYFADPTLVGWRTLPVDYYT